MKDASLLNPLQRSRRPAVTARLTDTNGVSTSFVPCASRQTALFPYSKTPRELVINSHMLYMHTMYDSRMRHSPEAMPLVSRYVPFPRVRWTATISNAE